MCILHILWRGLAAAAAHFIIIIVIKTCGI